VVSTDGRSSQQEDYQVATVVSLARFSRQRGCSALERKWTGAGHNVRQDMTQRDLIQISLEFGHLLGARRTPGAAVGDRISTPKSFIWYSAQSRFPGKRDAPWNDLEDIDLSVQDVPRRTNGLFTRDVMVIK
jgi:hypothetical protein